MSCVGKLVLTNALVVNLLQKYPDTARINFCASRIEIAETLNLRNIPTAFYARIIEGLSTDPPVIFLKPATPGESAHDVHIAANNVLHIQVHLYGAPGEPGKDGSQDASCGVTGESCPAVVSG